MKILIVENDESDLKDILELFKNFQQEKDFKLDISTEKNYEKVLKIANDFDIIVLDIELDDTNGIDLAKSIRVYNKDIRIIFISNYNRYLLDGYKAKADLYLLKPVNQFQFNSEMSEIAWDYIYQNQSYFNPKIYPTKLYYKDIIYIEMLQRKSIIHMVNKEEIGSYFTLKKWIEIIDNAPFAQPHRSFYVNLTHINHYELNEITMDNNERISITPIYKEAFQRQYFQYINRKV